MSATLNIGDLLAHAKVTRVSDAVAAGTSTVTSTALNMDGFDSCVFLVAFGAIVSGAVTSIKAQISADDADADAYADLAGTSQTVADTDDDKVFGIVIHQPTDVDATASGGCYLKCIVLRATQNSTVDGIIALQYNARDIPVTHDATTFGGYEFHLAPAEGTA